MKQTGKISGKSMCLFFCFIFLSYVGNANPLKKAKKVAELKEGVVVCNRSLLSNVITVPLSALTEELEIVRLDDADNALVKETPVEVGEKYILVKGEREIPYKLFEKKTGRFVTNIGSFGQGPNEYQNIYDHQLDEKNNRIYLLPWQTNKLLVYDLKGNSLPSIPLCFFSPKGKFKVDTEKSTVIVAVLPFKGVSAVAWEQLIDGKLLKSVEPGNLILKPDFSNEIYAYKTSEIFNFSISTFFELRKDYLYRYDVAKNKLVPLFTLDFNNKEIQLHSYSEIPDYYMGGVMEAVQVGPNTQSTRNHLFYMVDKKTLKGSFFELENDYLGGIDIKWPIFVFNGGYFVRNIDPGNLYDELEEILSTNKEMSPTMRTKLTKLKDSITDTDNNYILYARLKK